MYLRYISFLICFWLCKYSRLDSSSEIYRFSSSEIYRYEYLFEFNHNICISDLSYSAKELCSREVLRIWCRGLIIDIESKYYMLICIIEFVRIPSGLGLVLTLTALQFFVYSINFCYRNDSQTEFYSIDIDAIFFPEELTWDSIGIYQLCDRNLADIFALLLVVYYHID